MKATDSQRDNPLSIQERYANAKQAGGGALLMGDFYEAFFDDAKICAAQLGLTLTTRSKRDFGIESFPASDSRDQPAVPMAGFPHHQIDIYLKKLIQAGHRVAVCEPG